MDLQTVSQRLDANEKLKVKYRVPIRAEDGSVSMQERVDKLLDVDLERQMLFVAFEGNSVMWVQVAEALDVWLDDGVYE
ncbi:MAG: hypothetical protein IT209_00515 [Armatimonadetes bacterium]|nr:hypothetical protein [Armatimonadota bacterium]